jgi:hypothetical protein
MLKCFALSGFFLLAASPVAAQWMASENDNPFDKKTERFVFSLASSGAVLGVRCEGPDADTVAIVFGTNERTDGAAALVNALKPNISVIIDGGGRTDLEAEADSVEVAGVNRLRFVARGKSTVTLIERIAAAKRRISVASVVGGQTFHVSHFGASGSRQRIGAALKGCGVATTLGKD